MKIALLKDVPVPPQGADDVTWTAELTAKYGHMGQNPKKPGQWDIPFPVGQTFNVHWQYGIDWTGVTLVRSRMFREADLGFVLRFNYTDRREPRTSLAISSRRARQPTAIQFRFEHDDVV